MAIEYRADRLGLHLTSKDSLASAALVATARSLVTIGLDKDGMPFLYSTAGTAHTNLVFDLCKAHLLGNRPIDKA